MARTITLVSAGLGMPSSTRLLGDRLVESTVAVLREAGEEVDVQVVEVRSFAKAAVDALLNGFPSAKLREALDQVIHADGLVVVTPTFQGSYSGMFKTFMDLIEEGDLAGVPVILAATGGTERHQLVLDYALRPLFSYLRATPTATSVYAAGSDFGAGAAGLDRRIQAAGRELATLILGRGIAGDDVPARRATKNAFDEVTPFSELLGRVGRTV